MTPIDRRTFLGALLAPFIVRLFPGFPAQHGFNHIDAQGRKWEVLWTGDEWGSCVYEWWATPQFLTDEERDEIHPYDHPMAFCEYWEDADYATPREAYQAGWDEVRERMDTWRVRQFPEVKA